MSDIYVYFVCAWAPDGCLPYSNLLDLTPNGDGRWGRLVYTTNLPQAHFVVCLDGDGKSVSSVPNNMKIYLQREEPWIVARTPQPAYFFNGIYPENFYL